MRAKAGSVDGIGVAGAEGRGKQREVWREREKEKECSSACELVGLSFKED